MNLAVVSTNKNKFSETFIHNHVNYLPATIHFLFNGYLPTKYTTDKGLTEYEFIRKPNWFLKLFKKNNQNVTDDLIIAIENYFNKHKINAVLCEYGPSGVKLMNSCNKLNIPLIVHFHGYDAFRNDILNSYGKEYPKLFFIAKAVIAVSNDMKQQLTKLGCPGNKLNLITYGIDTLFFKPNNQIKKKYDVVFCGRFVAKKSPVQIINSFYNIIKQQPNLTMAMIGDGELLAECINLTKQLGIANKVHFMGAQTQQQVLKIYQQSKLFVNHSVTTSNNDSEGTPVTILEAMATGLIVVASNHAGIKDVISNNQNGFIVNENDFASFEQQLLFCSQHYDRLNKISENAILTIHSNYTLLDKINELNTVINNSLA